MDAGPRLPAIPRKAFPKHPKASQSIAKHRQASPAEMRPLMMPFMPGESANPASRGAGAGLEPASEPEQANLGSAGNVERRHEMGRPVTDTHETQQCQKVAKNLDGNLRDRFCPFPISLGRFELKYSFVGVNLFLCLDSNLSS